MHCMDHGHAIHRVKACSSFPWIKQSTHLSVEKFWNMWNFQRKSLKLRYQRTDRSAQAARMHCMGHWYAIRGVKACSSFRWIKQFTHLSVAKIRIRFDWRPQGGDFQRQSLKLRYQTDRYKCASSTHALYGSRTRHPSCESVLIIPLDQAIDSPVR